MSWAGTLLEAETTRSMVYVLRRLEKVATFDYLRADAIITQEVSAAVSQYDGLRSSWTQASLRGVALAVRLWANRQHLTAELRRPSP